MFIFQEILLKRKLFCTVLTDQSYLIILSHSIIYVNHFVDEMKERDPNGQGNLKFSSEEWIEKMLCM